MPAARRWPPKIHGLDCGFHSHLWCLLVLPLKCPLMLVHLHIYRPLHIQTEREPYTLKLAALFKGSDYGKDARQKDNMAFSCPAGQRLQVA